MARPAGCPGEARQASRQAGLLGSVASRGSPGKVHCQTCFRHVGSLARRARWMGEWLVRHADVSGTLACQARWIGAWLARHAGWQWLAGQECLLGKVAACGWRADSPTRQIEWLAMIPASPSARYLRHQRRKLVRCKKCPAYWTDTTRTLLMIR